MRAVSKILPATTFPYSPFGVGVAVSAGIAVIALVGVLVGVEVEMTSVGSGKTS